MQLAVTSWWAQELVKLCEYFHGQMRCEEGFIPSLIHDNASVAILRLCTISLSILFSFLLQIRGDTMPIQFLFLCCSFIPHT